VSDLQGFGDRCSTPPCRQLHLVKELARSSRVRVPDTSLEGNCRAVCGSGARCQYVHEYIPSPQHDYHALWHMCDTMCMPHTHTPRQWRPGDERRTRIPTPHTWTSDPQGVTPFFGLFARVRWHVNSEAHTHTHTHTYTHTHTHTHTHRHTHTHSHIQREHQKTVRQLQLLCKRDAWQVCVFVCVYVCIFYTILYYIISYYITLYHIILYYIIS